MTISNGSRVETQYGYDFLGLQCTVNLTTDADSVFQGEGTYDYPFSGSSITLNGNIFFEGRVSAGYSTRYVINGGRVRLPGNTQNNSYITYAQGMEPVLLDGGTGRTWDAPYTCYGFPQYAVSVTGGEALSFDAAIEHTIEGQRVVLKTEDQGWYITEYAAVFPPP